MYACTNCSQKVRHDGDDCPACDDGELVAWRAV